MSNVYQIDWGLIAAAERLASAINSHGVLSMVADYKFWADLAAKNPKIKEAAISAQRREDALRSCLIRNAQRNTRLL